ncbi:MAG: DUF2490 domain-containing protein [Pyrinomonadaceae bacterium]
MRLIANILLFMVIGASLAASAFAQTTDNEDLQSWNDVQLTIPVNEKIDVVLQTTIRFGQNITRVSEGRVGAGAVFKISKAVSFSPSYTYIEARNTAGVFQYEHRYSFRGTYKFPIKKFGLSHRSIYEYRVRASGNSWRYRPSITFEKDLPEKFLSKAKFFITEEPFYVSTTRKFSRNRLSLGITKVINKNLTLDVYYLRQNDRFSHPGNLNVLGTIWKFHL